MQVLRDGQTITLEAVVAKPFETQIQLEEMDLPEEHEAVRLRQAWLKN